MADKAETLYAKKEKAKSGESDAADMVQSPTGGIMERHAREREEMATRHAGEMGDMHKRHVGEYKDIAARHMAEIAADPNGTVAEPEKGETGADQSKTTVGKSGTMA